MRYIYKIGITLLATLATAIIIVIDLFDRNQYYSTHLPPEESEIFFILNDWQKQQNIYAQHFGDEKYKFPRENVSQVKVYKNKFLISRLTSTTLTETKKNEIIMFLNDPSNFDWGETTWKLSEAEYILRFFDNRQVEIGKVWLCLDGCGMTRSIPFSPNMKYGGLSKTGQIKIESMLKNILK